TLSKYWKSYDVFARQKISTFRSSRPAVLELAARYRHLLQQIESHKHKLAAAFEALKKAREEGSKERRVDIILDNAGFELFVDLVLAGYLLSAGLATL